jgi:hypothetical protein
MKTATTSYNDLQPREFRLTHSSLVLLSWSSLRVIVFVYCWRRFQERGVCHQCSSHCDRDDLDDIDLLLARVLLLLIQYFEYLSKNVHTIQGGYHFMCTTTTVFVFLLLSLYY